MRKSLFLLLLSVSVTLIACSPGDESVTSEIELPGPEPTPNPNPEVPSDPDTISGNRLWITVGTTSFMGTLADNVTATAFKALLPMTVSMNEMNGNEKYYYLSGSLPTATSNPGTIHSGDLMLYGSGCVVLFYETFQTAYSYTRIGSLDNPERLAASLGSGDVTITFELI